MEADLIRPHGRNCERELKVILQCQFHEAVLLRSLVLSIAIGDGFAAANCTVLVTGSAAVSVVA